MALDLEFGKKVAVWAILFSALTSVLSAAPRLQLSTAALGPLLVAKGGSSQQTVEASNPGDGALSLTIQTSASWLSGAVGAARPCTTTAGSCLPITITIQPGSLTTGTYTGYVSVSDPQAVDAPQEISVTATVAGVPDSITLYGAPGANGGNGNPTYSLVYPASQVSGAVSTQSGGNWLQFTLTGGGSFSFGTAYSIQATPLSAMAPGTYAGSVALSGSSVASENRAVGVNFNVTTSPIVQTPVAPIRIVSFPGAKGTGAVNLTNTGQGSLNVTGASVSASGPVPASTFSATTSGSTVTVTADAGSLSPGLYSGSLTLTSNAANNADVTIPIVLKVEGAGPVITQGGVINIATYQQESLAQGGLAAVYGDQLAAAGTSLSSPTVPLVKTLGGVQVLVNGVAAPLFYVSPGQINFQVPYDVPAGTTATVQVVSASGTSNLRSVKVVQQIPRIMPWPTYLVPGNYGIVVNYGDGSLVLPTGNQLPGFTSHPAKPGDLLIVYCLGLGQTNPGATTGAAGAAQTVSNVSVTFGGGFSSSTIQVNPLFAGLSGGVGLYQVNVYVPQNITPGSAVSLTFNVNGAVSNFVTIPISTNGQ